MQTQQELESFSSSVSDAPPVDLSALANIIFVNSEKNRDGQGRAIAFTGPQGGEGVTTITQMLASHLLSFHTKSTLLISAQQLSLLPFAPNGREQLSQMMPKILEGAAGCTSNNPSLWSSDLLHRKAILERLKDIYDHILIDCRPVFSSSDLLELTPLVDGAVLIVAANQTTRAQIRRTQDLIEKAGGVFLGCCLNRRTYPVPSVIHRKIQKMEC